MTGDMVLHGAADPFAFAEKIANSNLVPTAYRGKPTDLAIAVMYGNELGLPPMTALQRVVVINGKPTLDVQGFVSLIRQAGHSISGEVTAEAATVIGKRGDTGDTMTVTFTMDDAKRADLLKNATYRKFPSDMLWARAVTQLARRLFPDVMLAVSYVPEEMQTVVDSGKGRVANAPTVPAVRTVRQPPGTPVPDKATGEIPLEDEDIADAEIVDEPTGDGSPATTQQVNTIKRILKLNDDAATAHVAAMDGFADDLKSLADLTEAEADDVIGKLAS